jgi:hypothetical protein
MIDRGISENYVIYWMDDEIPQEHIERYMRAARTIARYGAGGRSLIELYESALGCFGGDQVLAAEYLRRALAELAEPTPIDDSFPPPDSWQWKHILRATIIPYGTMSVVTPPLRSARHRRSSR